MSDFSVDDVDRLKIRQILADIDQKLADGARKRQEAELAPRLYRVELWKVMVTALGTGAALFAAGAAFFKLLG